MRGRGPLKRTFWFIFRLHQGLPVVVVPRRCLQAAPPTLQKSRLPLLLTRQALRHMEYFLNKVSQQAGKPPPAYTQPCCSPYRPSSQLRHPVWPLCRSIRRITTDRSLSLPSTGIVVTSQFALRQCGRYISVLLFDRSHWGGAYSNGARSRSKVAIGGSSSSCRSGWRQLLGYVVLICVPANS